jgi:hypothetical protein
MFNNPVTFHHADGDELSFLKYLSPLHQLRAAVIKYKDISLRTADEAGQFNACQPIPGWLLIRYANARHIVVCVNYRNIH